MLRAPHFVLIGWFVALVPTTAGAQTIIGEYEPHPTRILGWGLVASFVLGTEPAIAIGIQADYLAFATEVSRIDETSAARGFYARTQVYFPLDGTPVHLRHALGMEALHGAARHDGRQTTPYFYGSRFGLAYRHRAGGRAATWGTELEPFVGVGPSLFAWTSVRFTPPLSVVFDHDHESHGWEYALSVGGFVPQTVGGYPLGAVAGRPFRVGASRVVAAALSGEGWSVPSTARSGLDLARAQRWTRAALDEHASIAAFAQLTLQLLAVGAPASLVRAAQRAGLDETRHAELCFSLARRFGAEDVVPGELRMPVRIATDLVTIALEAFHDGVIQEGLAAAAARKAAEETDDPQEARALRSIARDEARHAKLGERVVAWCLEKGGAPVRAALDRAISESTRPAMTSGTSAPSFSSPTGRIRKTPLRLRSRGSTRRANIAATAPGVIVDDESGRMLPQPCERVGNASP